MFTRRRATHSVSTTPIFALLIRIEFESRTFLFLPYFPSWFYIIVAYATAQGPIPSGLEVRGDDRVGWVDARSLAVRPWGRTLGRESP